jgi:hypothetical protein
MSARFPRKGGHARSKVPKGLGTEFSLSRGRATSVWPQARCALHRGKSPALKNPSTPVIAANFMRDAGSSAGFALGFAGAIVGVVRDLAVVTQCPHKSCCVGDAVVARRLAGEDPDFAALVDSNRQGDRHERKDRVVSADGQRAQHVGLHLHRSIVKRPRNGSGLEAPVSELLRE